MADPTETTRRAHDAREDAADARRAERRARWLLGAGAIAGFALASAGILEPAPSHSSSDVPRVAADVNGTIISEETYARALSALASDKRDPLTDDDRRHVLDRLIDEELLVQRAVALGLDRTNPIVRNTLVQAMIEIIVSGVGQREPEPEEVAAFYDANREFFARSDRYWVRQLRFPLPRDDPADASADDVRATAAEAAARLRAGERISVVAREVGGASVVPLPDGYLPAAKLREYVGPTPALVAATLGPGEVSDPIEAGSAWYVLQLVDRKSEPERPLAEVEPQIRAEMRRRAGDESLRSYLEALRADASIRVPE